MDRGSWQATVHGVAKESGIDVPGILQTRIPEWVLQGIFLTQGSNPHLLHCRQILYQLSHKGVVDQGQAKSHLGPGRRFLPWRLGEGWMVIKCAASLEKFYPSLQL